MSQRIDDVLAVLTAIGAGGRPVDRKALRARRVRALHAIAQARSVEYQTIADAYLRRLRPAVTDTAHFDELTYMWLAGMVAPLRSALLRRCLDDGDVRNVRALLG